MSQELVVGDKRVSFTAIKTALDTLGKRPDLVGFVHDVSSIKYGGGVVLDY